jgi:apolipoprotein N-acyltransferase
MAGAVFAVVSLNWLASVGADALIGMTALFAAWWAAMILAVSLTMRLRAWVLLVPAVWVLQEWLRSQWPLGGFPWARVGFAAVDSPAAALVPYLGVYGLTYLALTAGTLVVAAVLSARHSARRAAALGFMLIAGAVVGILANDPADTPASAVSGPTIVAAVVQGGPQPGPEGDAQARAVLVAHVQQTRALASQVAVRPDVVVWPESSTDIDPASDSVVRASIDEAVQAIGAPVVVGATTAAPANGARNQAILWLPDTGPSDTYTKRILVPFGEYVPGREFLGPLSGRFAQVARDFLPGDDRPVLTSGRANVGILICYEVAFDGAVQDAVLAGANVLAVPSNNATYRGTAQPMQQLAIARFRALETSRSVLFASTTGVSAIIGPDGTVLDSVADGQAGWRQRDVPIATDVTVAVRFGGHLGVVLAALGFLSIVAGGVRRLSRG